MQLDTGYLSAPEVVEFPTEGGKTAYMNVYYPKNKVSQCMASAWPAAHAAYISQRSLCACCTTAAACHLNAWSLQSQLQHAMLMKSVKRRSSEKTDFIYFKACPQSCLWPSGTISGRLRALGCYQIDCSLDALRVSSMLGYGPVMTRSRPIFEQQSGPDSEGLREDRRALVWSP